MTTSNKSLTRPSLHNIVAAIFLVVGVLGFLDATYLSVKHYTGGNLACVIFTGCDTVTTSPYAAMLGIPVALLGALYYLAVVLLSVAYVDTKKEILLRAISWGTTLGLLATAWFLYVQAAILHAFCLYCLLSATTSTILFFTGMTYISIHSRGYKKSRHLQYL